MSRHIFGNTLPARVPLKVPAGVLKKLPQTISDTHHLDRDPAAVAAAAAALRAVGPTATATCHPAALALLEAASFVRRSFQHKGSFAADRAFHKSADPTGARRARPPR